MDIVELLNKGVKLYCKNGGNLLPQHSYSTLACLLEGNREILCNREFRLKQKG